MQTGLRELDAANGARTTVATRQIVCNGRKIDARRLREGRRIRYVIYDESAGAHQVSRPSVRSIHRSHHRTCQNERHDAGLRVTSCCDALIIDAEKQPIRGSGCIEDFRYRRTIRRIVGGSELEWRTVLASQSNRTRSVREAESI